jgi:hypothetical protein
MLATVLALVSLSTPASASTLHVGDGHAFATIQSAVNAASTGDTVLVHQGTYQESVVIDDSRITELMLVGVNNEVITVEPPAGTTAAVIARNVDLRLKRITLAAPSQAPGGPVGLDIATDSGPVDLVMCDVDIAGTNAPDATAVTCGGGGGGNLSTWAFDVSGFSLDVGSTCPSLTDGWAVDDYTACVGW